MNTDNTSPALPPGADGLPIPPTPAPAGKWTWGSGLGRRLLDVTVVVLILSAIAAGVWYLEFREPEPRNDMERFGGEWKIAVAGGGETRDTDNLVRIGGPCWESVIGETTKPYRLTLNEATNPKQIDLGPIGSPGAGGSQARLHGIYAFDGKTKVRVRLVPASEPRPTTFDEPEANVWVLTLVRKDLTPK